MTIHVCQLIVSEVILYSFIVQFKRASFFFLSPSAFLFSPSVYIYSHLLCRFLSIQFKCQSKDMIAWKCSSLFRFFFLESDIERLKRRIESLVKSNDEKVSFYQSFIDAYRFQSLLMKKKPYSMFVSIRKEKSKIYKVKLLNINHLLHQWFRKRTVVHPWYCHRRLRQKSSIIRVSLEVDI